MDAMPIYFELISTWLLPVVWLLIELLWLWLAIFIHCKAPGTGSKLLLVGVSLSVVTVAFDTIDSYRYEISGDSFYDLGGLFQVYSYGYSYILIAGLILPGLFLVVRDLLRRVSELQTELDCQRR